MSEAVGTLTRGNTGECFRSVVFHRNNGVGQAKKLVRRRSVQDSSKKRRCYTTRRRSEPVGVNVKSVHGEVFVLVVRYVVLTCQARA